MTRPIIIVAGLLFAAGHLAVFLAKDGGDFTSVAYRWSCVLVLAGFVALAFAAVALHARQNGRGGVPGLIGYAGAVTGTVLMAGDWWFETFAVPFYAAELPQILDIPGAGWLAVGGLTSYLTFALGWAAAGFAALRSGAVGVPAGIGLIVGGLVGYLGVTPPWGIVTGLAIAWAGLALRPTADRTPETVREVRTPLN